MIYRGIAVSPGVVVGIAYRIDSVFGKGEAVELTDPGLVPQEVERFNQAVNAAASELESIVAKVALELGPSEAAIFRSHLQIVKDRDLLSKVRARIQSRQLTALSALNFVLQEYAATFARIEHDYYRERMADVRDVISRIASHLTVQQPPRPEPDGDDPIVLVTYEILPSQAMSLGELDIGGIVTETGGGTGHAAILSRSRGIPAVSGGLGDHRRPSEPAT